MAYKIFFDTEFTHLYDFNVPKKPELISIGCISLEGKSFYAENSDFELEFCCDFVHEIVMPLLQGGDSSMPYWMLAKQLRTWIESFDDKVQFISDAPSYDWPFVVALFDATGWPSNLIKHASGISFVLQSEVDDYMEGLTNSRSSLRHHHALDDAIAIKNGYQQAMQIAA